jgi:hypothetical protein
VDPNFRVRSVGQQGIVYGSTKPLVRPRNPEFSSGIYNIYTCIQIYVKESCPEEKTKFLDSSVDIGSSLNENIFQIY